MSSEKRLVLFMALTFLSFMGLQYLMEATGLIKPEPKKPAQQADAKPGDKAKPADAVAAKDQDKAKEKAEAKPGDKPVADAKPAEAEKPKVEIVNPLELVIGSTRDGSEGAYHLQVMLDQKGAGVSSTLSARYLADKDGRRIKNLPLQLIGRNPGSPPSLPTLSYNLSSGQPKAAEDKAAEDSAEAKEAREAKEILGYVPEGEIPLAQEVWEVVRDDKGKIVRELSEPVAKLKTVREGQEILFKTTVDQWGVTLTKRYRIWKGEDSFEVELGFESPQKEQKLAYRLYGPHSIPIEGEWYTSSFRDIFFGSVEGDAVKIVNRTGGEIAKPKADRFENTTLPLRFAGVENQYFATFIEPFPAPTKEADRWDARTEAIVIDERPEASQKADVTVMVQSKPFEVGPNRPVKQTYRVYAGPKIIANLLPYGAEGLASYRKYQWFGIPGAAWMSMKVIAPLLDYIYDFTLKVSQSFGGKNGNYGIAIILLTLLVRMIMFPIGRKQAMSAQKMQSLQPLMKEIQEKYKDDKERQTKETFALYKKHGVNPIGGCLPALIQLPIFVGLWQALNNSVRLRHASFLYIQNLAAPDMLFRFPTELPFIGEYFNLLPFLVVSLMIVQTKLFAPPATTPEAQMQQNMMKYMMVFMGFMFYKVPSGLGIYFITSSSWQICERLLLPKITHAPATPDSSANDDKNPPGGGGGGGGRGGNGRGPSGPPPKPPGRFAQFWEKVKEEATKDPTYRKMLNERDKAKEPERERERDRGKPRSRPGRRR
ncbi:membrane protein insertase YidC [Singulisphaera sp. PoT]|uniref:membrane protein insertase YidC n=1 Tax=Singulisphaera sp. PoT TaxID=3411797 RepID=UPI003BF57E00